jgi:hypothetical protein
MEKPNKLNYETGKGYLLQYSMDFGRTLISKYANKKAVKKTLHVADLNGKITIILVYQQ